MRLSEIKRKYRNQWVLVEYSKLDKDLRVKDGKVFAHASNKDDIYKALLRNRGKNVAIEYCGQLLEDMVVIFCLNKLRRQSATIGPRSVLPLGLRRGYRAMFAEDRRAAEHSIAPFNEALRSDSLAVHKRGISEQAFRRAILDALKKARGSEKVRAFFVFS